MKILVIIVLFLNIFTGCTVTYIIMVKNDGTASIKSVQNGLDTSEVKKYYQSSILSNIDTINGKLNFDISSIDSLGNYLSVSQKNNFTFHLDERIFSISEDFTKPFEKYYSSRSHINMEINFEKGIQEFYSSNNNSKQIDKNTIVVRKSKKQLLNNKKKINLIVKM